MKNLLQIFILLISTSFLQAQISFEAYQLYDISANYADNVTIGDVNNDGLNDVIVLTSGFENEIWVYLQKEDNTLELPEVYVWQANSQAFSYTALKITDINNDQLNDIVFGLGDKIGIFEQNQQGTLNDVTYINTISIVDGIAVADLNNDNLNDIAVAYSGDQIINVFYQQANGSFQTSSYNYTASNNGYNDIDIADLNNDGLNDIAYMTGQSPDPDIFIFYQGDFDNPIKYTNTDLFPAASAIALGDINSDGLTDLIASHGGNVPNSQIIFWTQNETTNLFNEPYEISTGNIPGGIQICDFNLDCKNDIIIGNGGYSKLEIFEQTDENTFGSSIELLLPNIGSYSYNPYHIATGDINNDGKPDIAHVGPEDLVIFLNNTSNTPELEWSATIFEEAEENDGSIETIITISLTNETFVFNSGSFIEDTHFQTNNLVENLSVQINVTSETTAEISLTGNAVNHNFEDNIDNFEITFLNQAFNCLSANQINGYSKTDLEIIFQDNVSTNSYFIKQISIYPNPSTGIFNLSAFSKPESVEITDITGKTIYNMTRRHAPLHIGNATLQIDISNQSAGIYFIKIQTENQIFTKKLIIY